MRKTLSAIRHDSAFRTSGEDPAVLARKIGTFAGGFSDGSERGEHERHDLERQDDLGHPATTARRRPGPSSTWSSTQLLSRWTAGSRSAERSGPPQDGREPGLLRHADPVVLGDAGLPAVHVLLHAGLEVRPRHRRPGEAEADLEPRARRPERQDPEPPHAVLRAGELGGRVEHREVGPLGGAPGEAGDERKRRRLARQDGDARLLRDVNGVPVAPGLLLDRVLLSEARVMDGAGVVLLHGVLHEKLPVAGDVVIEPAHAAHHAEVVRAELRREIAEVLDHAGPRLREAHEDEPLPHLGAHRRQAPLRAVEPRPVLHPRRAQQAAVGAVGPRVVRAHDRPAPAMALEQARAPVAAAVGERADPPLAVTQEKDRARHGVDRQVAPGLGQLVGPRDEVPARGEDAVHLARVELGRRVAPGGKRLGLADGSPDPLVVPGIEEVHVVPQAPGPGRSARSAPSASARRS